MNIIRKIIFLMSIFITLAVFSPMTTMAAPPDPDCDPLDPACPIDGGISILVIAGIGLGARRALKNQKGN